MADGCRILDATGALIFDETTPVVKFLGTLTIGWNYDGTSYTGATTSGSVTDARFTAYAQHVPFYARIDGIFSSDTDAIITFNGNTMTWTYPQATPSYVTVGSATYAYNRPTQTIIYGIR